MSQITLDQTQNNIVTSQAKNILVIAGAGSGKTRVLTERVKHLLESGVEPCEIVAITFTNMAAEELKERLQKVNRIGDVFIGTIHSFANRIYRNSGVNYSIMTAEAEQIIFNEILFQDKFKALTFKRWLQYKDLQKAVETGRVKESVLSEFLSPSEQNVLFTCGPAVKAIMKRDNIITFDELIEYATKYYKSLGATIEHLLVDELQDIDSDEYKFIRGLNATNYFFVGDDWQAIYGFKGGNVGIFLQLVRDKTFQKYYLQKNYRNCKAVITLGGRVINQVVERIDKEIEGMNPNQGKVTIKTKDQTMALVELLKQDKANWADWFILTRTNKEAYALADLLDDQEIDYCFIRKSDLTLAELKEALAKNLVKIMTVHMSKGLENKKVILYGNFPIMQPSYMRNMDERKVMYVGVTRAIDELHIFN